MNTGMKPHEPGSISSSKLTSKNNRNRQKKRFDYFVVRCTGISLVLIRFSGMFTPLWFVPSTDWLWKAHLLSEKADRGLSLTLTSFSFDVILQLLLQFCLILLGPVFGFGSICLVLIMLDWVVIPNSGGWGGFPGWVMIFFSFLLQDYISSFSYYFLVLFFDFSFISFALLILN